MAEKENELELEVGEKGGGKLKIIIIGVVALLLGGAGAFFFLSGDDQAEAATEEQGGTSQEQAVVKEPAIYVGVPEAIISPVKGKTRTRMVQIKMSFMVRGAESEERVKTHMPRLKNDLLSLVSAADADEIIKPEGRQKLQQQALEVVQNTMTELEGKPYIEKVLFVSFVMQ
jgi:flagellar FliL protein